MPSPSPRPRARPQAPTLELTLALPHASSSQDGNLLWEIGLTETRQFIEPDRWHATVCHFLQLMAYVSAPMTRMTLMALMALMNPNDEP